MRTPHKEKCGTGLKSTTSTVYIAGMSDSTLHIQGRTLTSDDLDQIRELIRSNPDWNRTRLLRELCGLPLASGRRQVLRYKGSGRAQVASVPRGL